MNSAIQIQNLQKSYGKVQALRRVALEIPSGEFFGLLGPNGAGKTTLISCIVGLAKPSQGQVLVFGQSVQKNPLAAKQQLGFSPQEVNVERFFNLQRMLEFQGGFYGLGRIAARKRAQELLEQFGLIEKSKEQFFRLSGGMQKRFLVARALVSSPKLLILDEPTAGVDVEQRHELWKYLRDLNRDGTTILLTTHYIDEAEALCERVGIIDRGEVMELGAPPALIEKYCQAQICLKVTGKLQTDEFKDMSEVQVKGDQVIASSPRLGATLEQLLGKILSQEGRRILDINVKRGNLEEVFLKVTGKKLSEESTETVPEAQEVILQT